MEINELAPCIDLTILRPEAGKEAVSGFCASALEFPFATVCVPPCHIRTASRVLKGSDTRVSTVAGFPLGFQSPGVKLLEARTAFESGASEIDAVMNIALFKSGELAAVEDEISEIVRSLPGAVIKIIIETCYLERHEKLAALELAVKAGAAFVKTSTGFGPAGATVEDVRLLSIASSGRILVKASGGIKDLKGALSMIGAGAARIGTSSGVSILRELLGAKD